MRSIRDGSRTLRPAEDAFTPAEVLMGASPRGRVLVLARGALGDTLLGLTLMSALPEAFRASSLSLAGNPSTLALFRALPYVLDILDHDRAEWAGLYADPPMATDRLAAILKRYRAAVVLAPGEDDPAARGLRALGMETVRVAPSRPPADRPVHLVDHQLTVIGLEPPDREPVIDPPEAWRAGADDFLEKSGLARKPFLALHAGSGGKGKNWPLENWLALAGRVEEDLGLTPLFPIGPAETDLMAAIRKARPRSRFAAGLSLPVLAGVIHRAAGYVGHDSGVTHLAARLGAPTLAVFGPTEPAHWAPRGPRAAFVAEAEGFGPDRQWRWPSVDRVFRKMTQIIPGDMI